MGDRCSECAHPDLEDASPIDSWHNGWHDEQSELQFATNRIAALEAQQQALVAALRELAALTWTTDDMRLTARVLGGTDEYADRYIAKADAIDIAIGKARAALAGLDPQGGTT